MTFGWGAGNGALGATFDHAAVTVGTSVVQLRSTSLACQVGVLVKASNANAASSIIYTGNSDVTNGSVAATDGFELGPGESVMIPVDDASKVYVIGSTASLRVSWLAI